MMSLVLFWLVLWQLLFCCCLVVPRLSAFSVSPLPTRKKQVVSTTRLFLEDWVADMIDAEYYRQQHRDEWLARGGGGMAPMIPPKYATKLEADTGEEEEKAVDRRSSSRRTVRQSRTSRTSTSLAAEAQGEAGSRGNRAERSGVNNPSQRRWRLPWSRGENAAGGTNGSHTTHVFRYRPLPPLMRHSPLSIFSAGKFFFFRY